MRAVKIDDLPANLRAQVLAQFGKVEHCNAAKEHTSPAKASTGKGPTKTEVEYAARFLGDCGALYEAITFRLRNRHRYTPDWTYWKEGRLHCVEVKGAYRLGSYQRARMAFDQAKVDFPWVTWVWAEKGKGGLWGQRYAYA